MSYLDLPCLKTYKLIYIMLFGKLEKSAPIRRGGVLAAFRLFSMCPQQFQKCTKSIYKQDDGLNCQKWIENAYFLRFRRRGGGGSAAKLKMTNFMGSLYYKEYVCQVSAKSVDIYYVYLQASQNHTVIPPPFEIKSRVEIF